MEIELTQGHVAQIDPEDWQLVAPYRWYTATNQKGNWYAHATPLGGNSQSTKIKMHNLILGRKWVDGLGTECVVIRPKTR